MLSVTRARMFCGDFSILRRDIRCVSTVEPHISLIIVTMYVLFVHIHQCEAFKIFFSAGDDDFIAFRLCVRETLFVMAATIKLCN